MTAPTGRQRPELIGHRGAPRELPENTLPSFLRALERGATALELDVHATADGSVVVHHDPVPRGDTTEDRLRGVPIADLTAAQLATFAVGGEPIPTLDAVLEAVAGAASVYVEIKGRHIERLVVEAIARSPTACAVHSFDHRAVRRVRELAPRLATGILLESYLVDPVGALRAAGARDYWQHWRGIDDELLRRVQGAGGRVIAWTVNGARDAAALARLGVDGLCTDDVREIAAAARA
jgi:glycerophosphoryl diester phosphodiesterase